MITGAKGRARPDVAWTCRWHWTPATAYWVRLGARRNRRLRPDRDQPHHRQPQPASVNKAAMVRWETIVGLPAPCPPEACSRALVRRAQLLREHSFPKAQGRFLPHNGTGRGPAWTTVVIGSVPMRSDHFCASVDGHCPAVERSLPPSSSAGRLGSLPQRYRLPEWPWVGSQRLSVRAAAARCRGDSAGDNWQSGVDSRAGNKGADPQSVSKS